MFQNRFKQITENTDRKETSLEALAGLYSKYNLPDPINYKAANKPADADMVFTSAPPVGAKRPQVVKLTSYKNTPNGDAIIVDSDNLMFTWEWDHVNNMMRKKYIN
jgi:hypothetical protein